MDLTEKQRRRLVALAAAIVERRRAEFKPEKPVVKDPTSGRVVSTAWLGSAGDMTMSEAVVKWWYSGPGVVLNLVAVVHVKQQVYSDQAGKLRVKLIDCHAAQWDRAASGKCLACGPDFTEHQQHETDTTIHEF